MSLQKKIEKDFLQSFKDKDKRMVSVLRLIKAVLTNKKIEKKIAKDDILSDEEVVSLLKSEVKKRQDSIESYEAGQRTDLADKERSEMEIIKKYLPEQLSAEKVLEIVRQVIKEVGADGPADFGKVMGAVMAKTQGRTDGQMVSKLVKQELSE